MMIVNTVTEQIHTEGHDDCVDITHAVQRAVSRAKMRQGLATVFVTGSSHHLLPSRRRRDSATARLANHEPPSRETTLHCTGCYRQPAAGGGINRRGDDNRG